MADFNPTTASSLAVALQLKPDALLQAGSGLRLTSAANANALARSVAGSSLEPTAALARAFGLGAGSSRLVPAELYSPNLTLLSGGGLIDGVVSATADSTGNGPTSAEALASNSGLANVTYLARNGQPLRIGTSTNPLAARAAARSDALLPDSSAADTSLKAVALVRGLEGSANGPRFFGQPTAVVEASSALRFDAPQSPTNAEARADAVGLESYRILAVPADPSAAAQPAVIGGDATANLQLLGSPALLNSPTLQARAVGVEASTISASWGRDTTLSGSGLARVSGDPALAARAALLGLGISASSFSGADGNDSVIAAGGTSGGHPSNRDAAGIDRSLLLTGGGNDTVIGSLIGDQTGGFDGIRRSTVRTGSGNDLIGGSSSSSLLDAGDDNDQILLEHSEASLLLGGRGNDALSISGAAAGNALWGGDGNDSLSLEQADGNLSGGNALDGGYGHDLIAANSGNNRYLQSMAGPALQAARAGYDRRLTEADFWSALSPDDRQELWQSGRLGGEAIVDTFSGFRAGSGGDLLELNSSLAGIRQDLWESDGALFSVNNGELEVIEGRGSAAIGLVIGTLAEIQSLGVGAPTLAYATDTQQLMFDADTNWRSGSVSLGTLLLSDPGALRLENLAFGATNGAALNPTAGL
jgi:Ca2+-binding RTX toxin-like protein